MYTGILRRTACLFFICLLLFGAQASAENSENASLKAEIEVLKERLAKLEEHLTASEPSKPALADGSSVLHVPSGISGIKLSGFADTSYSYNFNEPSTGTNTLRGLDSRAGDFMLNNVELALEKSVSEESPVGFRTDLNFGTDAEVTGSVTTGLGSTTDEFDLQQAYVQYLAPIGRGVDLKAGKFGTLAGAEVTESKDNWNFSRSFMWLYAEPLSHTGIRAAYPWADWVSTTIGVNNGWDVVDDNNKAKSLEFGATVTPLEDLSISSTYLMGSEQASDSRDQRHLFSLVASYQPIEKLGLKLAYDYGIEQDAASDDGGGNSSWNGIAAYAKFDVNDWYSIAGRAEVFNDQDGVRTGASAGTLTGGTIEDLQLFGFTLTNEFKLNKHLIARLEYRLDKADSDVFAMDKGFSDYQNTVAMEFIAPF